MLLLFNTLLWQTLGWAISHLAHAGDRALYYQLNLDNTTYRILQYINFLSLHMISVFMPNYMVV